MTQNEFLRQIGGVNSNSFARFMKLKGESGYDNGTYWGAKEFFQKRDADAKAAKAASKSSNKSANTTPAKAATSASVAEFFSPATAKKRPADSSCSPGGPAKKSKGAAFDELVDQARGVDLPTEAIFDNCDEVRMKALAFIAAEGVTTAAFLRACGNINSNSWNRFLSTKGPTKGRQIEAYPKAYRFLEKVRILRGQPKTKKRINAEAKEGPDGYSTERERTHMWVLGF